MVRHRKDRTGQSGCSDWVCCVRQDQPFEIFYLMAVDSRILGENNLHHIHRGQRHHSRARGLLSVERERVPDAESRTILKCTCRKLN